MGTRDEDATVVIVVVIIITGGIVVDVIVVVGVGVGPRQGIVEGLECHVASGKGGRECDGEGEQLLTGHRLGQIQIRTVGHSSESHGMLRIREIGRRKLLQRLRTLLRSDIVGQTHLPNIAVARLCHLL